MRKKYRCPKCGAETFYATAHVTQDWLIDCYGNFVRSENDCLEVTHRPDENDVFDCAKCGYCDAGKKFLVPNEE